ncbi:MAG: 3-dehydroquinate synthase [Gemmataceae bacterium]|nr:3-dehydroquinate synthase [Gemmataceae bacterium]MDW8267410.1 3-dehydroquinate synthase [Gemmataceae bacterium]
MPVETVAVRLQERSYEIVVTTGDAAGFGLFARQRLRGRHAFVVTDENAAPHARQAAASLEAAGFQTRLVVLPPGEAQKSLATAAQLYDHLVDARADRTTTIVAVGGGVIGDLAGFVAATFNRGLPLLMVPTTLLAMVDSSVGGKVGVNHPRAKNLIGAFHQPVGVWIDTAALDTLPGREYRSGLAEVVKYGIILDAEFFNFLEKNTEALLARDPVIVRRVIARCCRLKADVVEQDEREETGLRAVLNYGHTFAHAFETAAGYGSWLHGEAVAAGMVCASRLAERRGLIAAEVTRRQLELLQALQLPTTIPPWPIDALLETMRSDKKALFGRLRFVLPRRLGEVALFDDVSEDDVRAVLGAATSP